MHVCTETIRNDLLKFHEESAGLNDMRWALGVGLGLLELQSCANEKPDLSLNDEFCYPQRLGGWVAAGRVGSPRRISA